MWTEEAVLLAREYWPIATFYFPLGLIGLWRWSVWVIKRALAQWYRPAREPHQTSVSVVTPVYNENPELFREALETWWLNRPHEIIAVLDYSDTACIAAARDFARGRKNVRVIVTRIPGKRPALAQGIRAATSTVVALVDSDTLWLPDTMQEALRPFHDARVGGVSTRQSVRDPRTIAQRIFDIQLDQRYHDELPFLAATGPALHCLSGRTAFYRRAAVLPVLPDMVHETFWGKRVISGEDKRLTYLVLANGWRLAYQHTARVFTHGTPTVRGFLKQRLRWTRNSWRSDLRALCSRWPYRYPIFVCHLFDRLIQPFTLMLSPIYFVTSLILGHWVVAGVIIAWWHFSRTIRLVGRLRRQPRDILLLPHYIAVTFVIALLKLYALVTLNRQGWITRWDEKRLNAVRLWQRVPAYAATVLVLGVMTSGVAASQEIFYDRPVITRHFRQDADARQSSQLALAAVSVEPEIIVNDEAPQLAAGGHAVTSYVATKGDTLELVARRYGTTAAALRIGAPPLPAGELPAGMRLSIELNNRPVETILAAKPLAPAHITYWFNTNTIAVTGPGAVVRLRDIQTAVGSRRLRTVAPGEWYLTANLTIGKDVLLLLTRSEVQWLKLASNPQYFTVLTIDRGRAYFDGVRVSSWDQDAQNVDQRFSDGRSYILAYKDARLDIVDSDLGYLGYDQPADRGGVYGVSWRIAKGQFGQQLVTGEVRGSSFHHNYFGAYTFGATGMIWRGNSFFDNTVYGLDPHDDSNYFLVEGNRAFRNGKHGIIFSKRCVNNVIRNNATFANGRNGIMLHEESNSNIIENNSIRDNAEGIVLHQSSDNIIRGNTLRHNRYGVRLSAGSRRNVVDRNVLAANPANGIHLHDSSAANKVSRNEISGSKRGIYLKTDANTVHDNVIVNSTFGIYLRGAASGNRVLGNTIIGSLTSGVYDNTETGYANQLGGNQFRGNRSNITVREYQV